MAETLKKAIINKITKSRYDELVAAGTISPQMIREEAWLFTDDQYVSNADKQSWDAKADIWNIPTKTSQLTNNSGFITSSDIPSDVSAFTNDAGYITIQDVPKNVSELTNDVGYITQAAIPTNVSAFTNDAGYLTREVDPTVPSWAKEPTKPTYTKEEIGLGNVENKSSETIRSEITSNNVTNALGYTPINPTEKGSANGIAELDSTGKVPSSQLPAYVDDVIEYDTRSDFPATGESGKIYIAKDTNLTYRWSGTTYVTIASDLALGETHSTAYYGDLGKIAYDHSQAPHAPANAQANVIESISVNGTTETITNKNVDITVPTNNNQLTNGAGYITQNDIPTNVSAFNNDANYITNANETDPVFSSSPAFSITNNDITNWNAKAETTDIKDGTLTIKQNGTTKGTFSANQNTDVNVDIEVPTKVSDITNDLHYITSNNNSIANIIELTYDEYQQLVADDEVDPDTEYHIIDAQSTIDDLQRTLDNLQNQINTIRSTYLPLTGGTMTGNIVLDGAQVSSSDAGKWIKSRDKATVKNTNNGDIDGYAPVVSQKTKDGNWAVGCWQTNNLIFNYTTDTDYENDTNTSYRVEFTPAGVFTGTANKATYDSNNNNIYENTYFKPNDTYEIKEWYSGGFIDNNSTVIKFTIPLPKRQGSVTGATITGGRLYVMSSTGNIIVNRLSLPDSKVDIQYVRDGYITIFVTDSSGFNAPNNSPVGVQIDNMTVEFS